MRKILIAVLVGFNSVSLMASSDYGPSWPNFPTNTSHSPWDMPVPAVAAPAEKAPVPAAIQKVDYTQVIIDTQTGQSYTIIPVTGGFIYASNGQFVSAVFNGGGYILPSGQYLPLSGGRRVKGWPANPAGPKPDYALIRPDGVSLVTVDKNARLMWVTDPIAAGIGGTYNWAAATRVCKALNYAGYSDWRLPKIDELAGIIDIRFKLDINPYYFFNTSPEYYWSATGLPTSAIGAWVVTFTHGEVVGSHTNAESYVRCVRGGR